MIRNSKNGPRHPPVRVIAITGCDGSGKSTLASSLVNRLSPGLAAEVCYLGQSSGRLGEWISRLPVIGAPVGRYLLNRAGRVHQHPASPPGNIAALAIFLLSCWRALKFRRMLHQARRGVLLITDRYPQAEAAGFRVDGPQLARAQGGNRWVKALRRWEQLLYQWMASYPPLLLLRLDIDEQTAHQRKPDHDIAALREKISVIPRLNFNGATIIDLNGQEPASKVLDDSLRAIRLSLSLSPSVD